MACLSICDSPLKRSLGYESLTTANNFFRYLFKGVVSSTILFDDRFRAITFPLSFAYASASLLTSSSIVNRFTNSTSVIKNATAITEKIENGLDSFSLLYSIYAGTLGVVNFFDVTPAFFLSPFAPAILAGSLALGMLINYWRNKGKQNEISEKQYAFGIARKGAGFLATFYLQMMLVLEGKSFSLADTGVLAVILGLMALSYQSERQYAKKERVLNSASVPTDNDVEGLLSTDNVQSFNEPKASRNFWARCSESLKAGWFFGASLFSLTTWVIHIKNGEYLNKTGPTPIPDPAAITFLSLSLIYLIGNFAKVRIPPGYEAYRREHMPKRPSGTLFSENVPEEVVEKVNEVNNAFTLALNSD